jgi:hypothetical protein
MSAAPQAQEAHLQVRILYNGAIREFPYRPHERLEHLLVEARRAFGITINPHLMALFDLAGTELADSRSLREDDVKPGDELVLRQSVVRGG